MKIQQHSIQSNEPTLEQLTSCLIISVGETRKLLGTDAKHLDDNQIATQVFEMSELAQELLKYKHFA
jgi:hypothetical protein